MKKTIGLFLLAAAVLSSGLFLLLPLPGSVPVLMYHFVASDTDARESKNFVSRESFARQMRFLKFFGYRVISMEDYAAIISGKKEPRGREVVLTFDDGNTTFKTEAFPVLKKYEFPATIFLVSESVKREINGSMSEGDVKMLAASGLVTIGSHTQTHPNLSEMNDLQIKQELEVSKSDLEAMFGKPVRFLAYPSGRVDARGIKAAQAAGYELAFTTSEKKLKGLENGIYAITRAKISRTSDNPIVFWAKLSGIYQSFKHRQRKIKMLFSPESRSQAAQDLPRAKSV